MPARFGDIPVRANALIAAGLVALSLLLYVGVPLWVIPRNGYAAIAVVVLVVLTTNTFWAIIHEAIHSKIHPSSRVNEGMGRVLCILFGSQFQLLRFGHLMHHKFNRSAIDRSDIAEVGPPPATAAKVNYYVRLLAGLYLLEVAAALLALLPKPVFRKIVIGVYGAEAADGRTMRVAAEAQLLEQPGYGRMQVDGLVILAMLAFSFWLYGASWWMLALALLGRGFLISFFDNAYHYGNPLDEVLASYNLRLPKLGERFILNFNLHATHHRYPRMPWSVMPTMFQRDNEIYHYAYFSAAARQLKGLVPAEGLQDAGAQEPLKALQRG